MKRSILEVRTFVDSERGVAIEQRTDVETGEAKYFSGASITVVDAVSKRPVGQQVVTFPVPGDSIQAAFDNVEQAAKVAREEVNLKMRQQALLAPAAGLAAPKILQS